MGWYEARTLRRVSPETWSFFTWGQLLWPTMVTRGEVVRPLPLGLFVFQISPPLQWGVIMAFAALLNLPVLAIFLACRRRFAEGVASSGLTRR